MADIVPMDELDEDTVTQATSVLSWYESQVRARRVDIVGDYAGKELFLIEGDSVLLNSFSDPKLDFEDGFQMLHAAYAVEAFLRGLVTRKCNFHIVFFEQNRELCIPPGCSESSREKFLLARATIIRHLLVNLKETCPDIEVHLFDSFHGDDFSEYLEATDLYFVLCHDGASPFVTKQKALRSAHKIKDHVKDESDDIEHVHSKTMLRSMIFWFIKKGYNAALVNGLEWRDTKVITAIIEGFKHKMPESLSIPLVDSSGLTPNTYDTTADKEALATISKKYGSEFDERDYLAVLVTSKMLTTDEKLSDLAATFLLHVALLAQSPLSERRVKQIDPSEASIAFLTEFCHQAGLVLGSNFWQSQEDSIGNECNVADLVDGRIFNACLLNGSIENVPRLAKLLDAVELVCGIKLSVKASKASSNGNALSSNGKPTEGTKPWAVLPFTNPVFDAHLSAITLLTERTTGSSYNSTSAKIFREMTHWHNSKRPIDPKLTPEQELRNKKKALFVAKRNQWFMAEMMAYAASLTNAIGKILDPEIITTGPKSKSAPAVVADTTNAKQSGKQAPKPAATQNQKNPKKGGKAKGGKQAIMDEIAAARTKKEEGTSEKLIQGWKTTCKAFEAEATPVARFQKAKHYLSTLNTDIKRSVLSAEVQVYMLNTLLDMWITVTKENRKIESLPIAAMIFHAITKLSTMSTGITKTIASYLKLVIKSLALPQVELPPPDGDRTLAFSLVLNDTVTLDLSIQVSPQDFQLLHYGPYFDRSIDSAPDPRVPFEPDGWQRKVLDEIDARRSLLVVAPTSAGKTFISFYAMKQVLESNDDDVLVYVAPTKALVNQIAAEVQARFSKSFKYPGKSVWGIHTRDYRINNPTGCQILVTVPHILQIMLLAPSNANGWSKRVKRIIFDEVHCIGQAEDGIVWEQLLLLAPCPIIALSATIGNPKEFNEWLLSTQKALGNDLTMVSHPHRYSDLRKFVYTPPRTFNFQSLTDKPVFGHLGLDETPGFTFMHPIASLVNKSRGMPEDLSFEARDCLTLWTSMNRQANQKYPLDESLSPSNMMPKLIKKLDIIKWEQGLKKVLRSWLTDSASPFDAVMKDLGDTFHSTGLVQHATAGDQSGTPVDPFNIKSTTLPLLVALQEQDALPAIFFNYDRAQCESICRHVLDQLKASEDKWKDSSPKWKKKLADWDAWKKSMAKIGKKGVPKLSKKRDVEEGVSKEDLMKDAASADVSPWASFEPDNPVEGFTFADNKKILPSELGIYMRQLFIRDLPEWQSESLKRGIGVHHAGMNRKYRQVVEMLFRKGYLRVIIATGTLALGINMPCKTVVFSGDSVFLTALNFRQAAGRAGRRGFDMLGNVVFQNIPTSKICRLVSSKLPDLNGHFPITTTLVLRLFSLLHESKNSQFAVRSINSLLSQPRLYLGGEESKMTVLHHLRFSIEYLRRQYLLDAAGAPLNFAGCVSHLYFTENSAFAFHALLKEGYFHAVCKDIETNPEEVLRTIMLTMSHIFGRQYCRQVDAEFIEAVVKRSSSLVFLPSMSKLASSILRTQNAQTLDIFTAYVRTFVDQNIKEPDCFLPLTQLQAGAKPGVSKNPLPHLPATNVRSSFVALSGHGDEFEDIHDLCASTRSGVFLEEAVIPYVGLYPDELDIPLNAYLYDFFMNGDVNAVVTANGIRRGDIWFFLNDFSLVLATIVTSFSNYMKLSADADVDLATVMGGGDAAEENKEERAMTPDQSGNAAAMGTTGGSGGRSGNQASGGATPIVLPTRSRKKVVDSWDTAEDAEAAADADAVGSDWDDEDDESDDDSPAWEDQGLLKVLKAFQMLKKDFDTKFRVMWA
ncbi:DEAD/DEAH box helicase-like protein [Lophium mytilinum]|uniref:DEAD/DEAH box helicase-like protein n=1 Tax=Lophium mytilinum TaxID=390894 RepID=A0A6A6QYA1_9PEZI|nr:DEAD/DEAH box helicase-like protein [Lophium mytilinum]